MTNGVNELTFSLKLVAIAKIEKHSLCLPFYCFKVAEIVRNSVASDTLHGLHRALEKNSI